MHYGRAQDLRKRFGICWANEIQYRPNLLNHFLNLLKIFKKLTCLLCRIVLSLQKEDERLRRERNAVANKMKGKLEQPERQKLIEEGKSLKEGLARLEEDLIKLTDDLQMEAQCIPNTTHPDVPIGGEDCSTLSATLRLSRM